MRQRPNSGGGRHREGEGVWGKAFQKETPSSSGKESVLLHFRLFLLWCCLTTSPFSLYSSNTTNGASGGLSTLELCRFQFAPPTSFSCQGSWGSCASPLLPASTCLAKGLHSAEASFLCTQRKQLFLLSLLLMLSGELADHFLLMDITPPRNDGLPPSVLLIIKRHFLSSSIIARVTAWARMLLCQGQQGRLDHWIPREPRESMWQCQRKPETRLPQLY